MSIVTIKDAIRALAQSLQVATVFPSALFVLVNAYIILPALGLEFDLSKPSAVTIVISLTLMLSYTLYAFNFPLIRFLEGYKLQEADFFQWNLKKQQRHFADLEKDIGDLRRLDHYYRRIFEGLEEDTSSQEEQIGVLWDEWQRIRLERARSEFYFDRDFPSRPGMVLPTRLGNTIAAFEDYPRTRYGMDSIVLWGRLVPLLKEKQFLEFVSQEKSVFDFLLNTSLVVVCLGLELSYLCLFLGKCWLSAPILLLTFVAFLILYNGMIVAARQWGTTVRVAFDLYRHDLSQRLGLRPTKSFKKEVKRWRAVSRFLLYRQEMVEEQFKGFISQKKRIPQSKEK